MVFSSSIFLLIFLPVFLLLYELSPKKIKNYTLLAASILFYAWGAPKFIFVLIGFTIINYFIVGAMSRTEDAKKQKLFLTLSIILNLLLLVVFKYSNLFVHSLNDMLTLLGMTAIYWKEIALPIGISFFIFQSITYSVDVYRKESMPARNYANYLLYIISFPQLIAGPIVRYKTIAAEIDNREATSEDKLQGFYRFIIGLAKKAIIANAMAMQADILFGQWTPMTVFENLSTPQAWICVIAYTFQIYFDFSGYSDMAIGLGRMMGFHYPENFNMPYISKNVSEFWKRWHITLGDFMMNYLYIPLGGNRTKTKARNYFNLWIVFLLSGLWHGASWTFLIWGAFHGVFIVLDKIGTKKLLSHCGTLPQIILTFFIVSVGWSIFACDSISKMGYVLKALFNFNKLDIYTIEPIFVPVLCFAVFFAFFFENKLTKRIKDFFFAKSNYSLAQHAFLFPAMLILLVLSIAHIIASGYNPFIYFRF